MMVFLGSNYSYVGNPVFVSIISSLILILFLLGKFFLLILYVPFQKCLFSVVFLSISIAFLLLFNFSQGFSKLSKFLLHYFLSPSYLFHEHLYLSLVCFFTSSFSFKNLQPNIFALWQYFYRKFFFFCLVFLVTSLPFLYLSVDLFSFFFANSSVNMNFCPVTYLQEIFNGKELEPHSKLAGFPLNSGFFGCEFI